MKNKIRMLILISIMIFIGFQIIPEKQKIRFDTIGSDETSMQRILYFKNGIEMIKEHPIIGVGYFNFAPYYTIHHSDDLLNREKSEVPHNIFIQVGTDTGIFGLSVYIILIGGSWRIVGKIGKEAERIGDVFVSNLAKGMNLGLLGYVIAGQFVTVAYYPYFWIHLVFVTAMGTFWSIDKKGLCQLHLIDSRD